MKTLTIDVLAEQVLSKQTVEAIDAVEVMAVSENLPETANSFSEEHLDPITNKAIEQVDVLSGEFELEVSKDHLKVRMNRLPLLLLVFATVVLLIGKDAAFQLLQTLLNLR